MELVKSLKQSKLIKYVFFALIGSIALAISSKIKIPFYPVPMTMQTFIVLVIGIGFGIIPKLKEFYLCVEVKKEQGFFIRFWVFC